MKIPVQIDVVLDHDSEELPYGEYTRERLVNFSAQLISGLCSDYLDNGEFGEVFDSEEISVEGLEVVVQELSDTELSAVHGLLNCEESSEVADWGRLLAKKLFSQLVERDR